MASEIKVDTISEKTSAGGVTIDGLLIKDGGISGDVSLIGTTPTFTIGDAGAEDATLLFDGNAQDFHIGLDDSADDLVIGVGSALGTTTAIAIDENANSTFSGTVTVGVDDTGKDVKLFGATSGSYMLWDESADDLNLIASGLGVTTAKDLGVGVHIRTADSGGSVDANCDELVIENSGGCGLTILSGTSNLGRIAFGDSGAAMNGRVQYDHTNDSLDFYTSGTEHMSIDSTGAVTKPLQPAFSCLQSTGISAQSLTDATAIIINLNSEIYDVNGDASSTGVFTAPATGKYMISCKCGGDAGSSSNVRFDNVVAQLHTSNRIYYFDSGGTVYSDVNDKVWSGGSVLADMDASDTATLKFYVKRNGDTTATTTVQSGDSSGLSTFMTGYLAC